MLEQLDKMEHGDYSSESFFDPNPLQQIQQIEATADLTSVPNITVPRNAAVIEQIARRWYCGCLERIAWSKYGHLASISDDASTVYVECLRYNQESKSWELHGKHGLATVFEDAINLAWSSTGAELAVVDVKGRIWIYHSSHAATNRLTLARQGALDEGDESSQPVGMSWLNQDRQDRPRNAVLSATKTGDRWQHANARAKPLGPYWHRAVALVHRNGQLTLCFQKGDGRYSKVTKQLAPDDEVLYTHAAFAPTLEGKMLIALHSFESVISVYFVSIDWTEVRNAVDGVPTLTVEQVPSKVSSVPSASPTLPDVYDPDSWSLSHLEIVQTTDVEKAVQIPPTIVAVSSGVNRSLGIAETGYIVSSFIKRWAVSAGEQKLHPLFAALPSTGSGSSSPKSIFTLQQQLPDKEEQVITSVHRVDGMQALVVTTPESRSDFLNTDDMSSMAYATSSTQTSSMYQSGFTFPYAHDTLCPVFSSSACVRADFNLEGKIQVAAMEYQMGQTLSQTTPDPSLDNPIAALNLTFARACWSNATIDDIIMCATHSIPSEAIPETILSMYRAVFRDTEFVSEKTQGSELERMFHKQVMGKVMAYHAGLTANCTQLPSIASTEGRNGWPLSAQWAWTVNNLRHTATLLFMNLRDVQNVNLVMSQDFTDVLCANLRWGLSVLRYIFSTILEVGDRETNPEMFDNKDRGRMGDTLGDGSQGLVALLLNCHASRIFLIAFVRGVRAYAKNTEPKSSHQVQVLQCIQQQTTGKGISFPAIEALLEYRWYAQGDVEGDLSATASRQLEMMAKGIVHESYQGTIKTLVHTLFNSPQGLRAKMLIDRLKLFTDLVDPEYLIFNRDVLGRRNDETKRIPVIYDVHRKRPISTGVAEVNGSGELMIRKCVRCGGCSEDVNGPPREWPRQVALILARCTCDGSWVIEPWNPN